MKWEDIYKVWKWEMCKFPVLSAQKYCLKQKFLNRDLDRVTASTGLKKKERRNLLNLMYIYAMIMQVLPLLMPVRQGGAKEQLERLPCYVLVKRKKSLLLFGFVHLCFL